MFRVRFNTDLLQIKNYIVLACLKPGPSPNLDNTTIEDLKRVYNRIICPAWYDLAINEHSSKLYLTLRDGENPYVFDGEELRVEWTCSAHGIPVPITDFYTAFSTRCITNHYAVTNGPYLVGYASLSGWVVTVTESPMRQAAPAKYTKLLCVFSKWCDTVSSALGRLTRPNTVAIFWTQVSPGQWQTHYGAHLEIFTIYTNLPQMRVKHPQAKEKARHIRKKHLEDIFGDLGTEPKAESRNPAAKNTKFGHCAETISLTRSGSIHWFCRLLTSIQLYIPGQPLVSYKYISCRYQPSYSG